MNRWQKWAGLVVLSVLISAPSMAKKVYKWVDENGVTHYSDSTPASVVNDKHNVNQVSVTEDLPSGNYRGVAKKPTYTSLSQSETEKPSRGKDPATQCYSAIKNMTAGLAAYKQRAKEAHMRKGMKENEFEAKYQDAVNKINKAKTSCVDSYTKGGGSRIGIDCLADLKDPEDFIYCAYASRLTGM
ncbi:DUF4124 domain-containing protein [Motilimonas sp. KMU-193]|uniref:DUF4124 domain-containing protein n=1 Tax=Motilimonas sp. KMU-193 TaxID=3388668 RepID=UPI00396B41F8